MSKIFTIIGVLAVITSVAMYIMGNNSANLTELKDFWWAPLPLAVICFLLGNQKKKV